MRFTFRDHDDSASGYLAFTDAGREPLLLATDAGHAAVHVVDVVGRRHVGYVAPPGTVAGPRGVATKGSLAAVSAFRFYEADHVVHLYQGGGSDWAPLRDVEVRVVGSAGSGNTDGQLCVPWGVRVSADGTGVVVADWGNNRVSLFRVADGAFVRHVATGLDNPGDVEEVEGGWVIACQGPHAVEFVADGDGAGLARPSLGQVGEGDRDRRLFFPSSLALVPGVGLVVRDYFEGGRVQFFASPDDIAMAAMSCHRVAWMVGVARAAIKRWWGWGGY